MNNFYGNNLPRTPPTREFVCEARRSTQRWLDYTTGNPYVLYYRNRTLGYGGRVQGYGNSPLDCVRRFYNGQFGNGSDVRRQSVRVVSLYSCVNERTCESGDLLLGQQQQSFPY